MGVPVYIPTSKWVGTQYAIPLLKCRLYQKDINYLALWAKVYIKLQNEEMIYKSIFLCLNNELQNSNIFLIAKTPINKIQINIHLKTMSLLKISLWRTVWHNKVINLWTDNPTDLPKHVCSLLTLHIKTKPQ